MWKVTYETDCTQTPLILILIYSELHMFRGVEPAGTGFIMGHEFVGEIVELGSAVKTLRKGDRVVTAFTTSWSVPDNRKLLYCLGKEGLR